MTHDDVMDAAIHRDLTTSEHAALCERLQKIAETFPGSAVAETVELALAERASQARTIAELRATVEHLSVHGPQMQRGTVGDGNEPWLGTMREVLGDYQCAAEVEARAADQARRELTALRAELATARSDLEAARRDAERYRHLRDARGLVHAVSFENPKDDRIVADDDLDACVDRSVAAIATPTPELCRRHA